jgi:hypothetical protein
MLLTIPMSLPRVANSGKVRKKKRIGKRSVNAMSRKLLRSLIQGFQLEHPKSHQISYNIYIKFDTIQLNLPIFFIENLIHFNSTLGGPKSRRAAIHLSHYSLAYHPSLIQGKWNRIRSNKKPKTFKSFEGT